MTEHELFNKPGNICNSVVSGIQIINKPGKFITAKGSKNHLRSAKRSQFLHVIMLRDDFFTVLMMKGINKKKEMCEIDFLLEAMFSLTPKQCICIYQYRTVHQVVQGSVPCKEVTVGECTDT